jgi:hypothetical protein
MTTPFLVTPISPNEAHVGDEASEGLSEYVNEKLVEAGIPGFLSISVN